MSTATLSPGHAVSQAVKKVSAIATLPEVTARIIATVEDPNSSPAQLHHIVANDPALVTRILKVVNSAFYGLPGQVASVERAIVLLGLNAVKNIAVAASLGQLFRGVRLCEGFSAKDLWMHCIATAVTARDLARQLRVPLADEAFLAGMIHDVGLLVSLQLFPDQLRSVCDAAPAGAATFPEIERQLTGVDHQQLGAALAEQWKFPRSCQLVAGNHHHPTALHDDARLLVTIAYAADTLVCQGQHGFNLTALSQNLADGGLDDMGLTDAIIERTRGQLPQLISEASTVFA